jgi:uncharacterized protein (DUF488 family)
MKEVVYTIGHSTHHQDYFLSLLKDHGINCVVDVRTIAASRFNPQYNKKRLSGFLNDHGIVYMHFAEEFGARRTDPSFLDETGRVDFLKVRRSDKFADGMNRIREGLKKNFTIALMCAEADPFECHRFGMITPAFQESAIEVLHILKDKSVLSNVKLVEKLLSKYRDKLSGDLFSSTNELERAYRLLNAEIGYTPSPNI